jgi:predicted unusual protein kinase regulating ubiquinone biosynthesis (AarF/ABC1/UbiB family)
VCGAKVVTCARALLGVRAFLSLRALGWRSFAYQVRLGPTFVKLGQVVSTRTDIFSDAYIQVLV